MAAPIKNSNPSPQQHQIPPPQQDQIPSIRIVPHIDGPRSLHFDIIGREVPEGSIIKIGRFTDKTHFPNRVTFKSKVVSRGHAEIWWESGKFFIKDTKSSSGTFLNHVRLSSPNQESKPYALKDGDVIQLGVDYQGGTEEIYRCVKMRIELNRSWQRKINPFNLNALRQVKQLTGPDAFKHQTTDCCICLCSIGPCQALFIAPCSHVFHYNCIRPILVDHHPGFLCPLCRSFADLEASTENAIDWEQALAEQEEAAKKETEGIKSNKIQNQNAPVEKSLNQIKIDLATPIPATNNTVTAPASQTQLQIEPSVVKTKVLLPNNNAIPKQLDPIQINSHLLTQEEIKLFLSPPNRIPSSGSPTPPLQSSVILIPRNNKKSHTEDHDENGIMLARTLPSSPPQNSSLGFFDDNMDSGPSSPANLPIPTNRERVDGLGGIVEEDEGSMSSSSSGPSGRFHRENRLNMSATSVQDLSSSSASVSDNDDDALQASLQFGNDLDNACSNYNLVTEDDGLENGFVEVTNVNSPTERVKGKGVERSGLERKENIL